MFKEINYTNYHVIVESRVPTTYMQEWFSTKIRERGYEQFLIVLRIGRPRIENFIIDWLSLTDRPKMDWGFKHADGKK